jgi:Exo-beta-D-glucosaminidase Ig-fold domain/Glycosyl hydrolases family 2/Concanavalin A-like lectin/glucanases superfamily/Glycosyl hydrolases family 2, sugar binding domain/Glycosyl hydrolases family 2, TIM barrel domain
MNIETSLVIGSVCVLVSMGKAAPVFGPFDAEARGAGPGHIEWFDGQPPTEPGDAWTIAAWVKPKPDYSISAPTLVAGFGDGVDFFGAQRFLAADASGWFFWYGNCQPRLKDLKTGIVPVLPDLPDRVLFNAEAKANVWKHLAASFDGKTLRLFVDGKPAASEDIHLTRAAMQPLVAPPPAWQYGGCFAGKVARFTIWNEALPENRIAELAQDTAGLDTSAFAPAPAGDTPFYRINARDFCTGRDRNLPAQDPATYPNPVPPVKTERIPKLSPRPVSSPDAAGNLALNRGWEMADAWTVQATPEQISKPGFNTASWYDATVPGTALTTLVQQGVFPDPLHGLNNMLIPDLATKSWWYRVEFHTPATWKNRNVGLTFKGINYHSEIWLNGRKLGNTSGAFIRGQFDVTPALATEGNNVLAVRVWPQPHYNSHGCGDESIAAGAGPNGGDGTLDGPSFFCTDGWDWIPTIRDRCTGIWQDVVLHPTGSVKIGDPQIVTTLPKLPDLSVAEVAITSDLRNLTQKPQTVTVEARIAGAKEKKSITLPPGATDTVNFHLTIQKPKLWWPNGYGEPTLHDFTLSVTDSEKREVDRFAQRVGLRQLDYEYLPSPKDNPTNNPLVVKVNGRRIYVRGGNWGMDDALKRSSTDRLEPYFRLHRDAHFTMIRNWCGQNTQENFYELADKYGILVWNDFWLSTTSYNNPAIDGERFLANAEDVIKRFRNHAAIAVWCGRNEGFPPTWINEPLARLLTTLDGTRAYIPQSTNRQFLLKSGPWAIQEPDYYYTRTHGYSTELGVNSVPTADAMRAMLDPSQYWPATEQDAWAYHDFHSNDNGSRAPYLAESEKRYGVGQNLDDFIRRIQMLNYTQHRLMFEAWNASLWNPSTGLFLWMTHPAWPSTVWQVYSSDYDTHAAFYGCKKACEPVHVQWNLNDDSVSVINNPEASLENAILNIKIIALDGAVLSESTTPVNVAPNSAARVAKVAWADFTTHPAQFLKLELLGCDGKLLSENFYWHSQKPEQLQALEKLPQVGLSGSVHLSVEGGETIATVDLTNPAKAVALMTHLSLRNADTGTRILPAYASDNYVSLLPGEKKTLTIRCATKYAAKAMAVSLDGWNITPAILREK